MGNEQYTQFNCYSILSIKITATPNEIKSAYRKTSLKTHPDVGGSSAEQAKVNLAYEILSDPIQRQAHDIYWKAANGGSSKKNDPEKPAQKSTGAERPSKKHSSTTESLSAFRKKLEQTIQARKAAVWVDIGARVENKASQFERQLGEARRIFFYLLAASATAGLFADHAPILWLISAGLGSLGLLKLKGAELQGKKKFPLFGTDAAELKKHAESTAAKQCHDEACRYDRYLADFASIVETAARPSSFDDSEIHVARRITVALFLMGYVPSHYDSDSRTILFTDKDENLMVRFRHRAGSAINISYVERLRALMQMHSAKHGILFCSPGLSGNAAQFAQRQGIKSYSLERMNAWIDKILPSNYSGPSGDILANLDQLKSFLSDIVPKVGYSPRRSRRWR